MPKTQDTELEHPDEIFNEEWVLETLLRPGEMVISSYCLRHLIKDLEAQIDRYKYYESGDPALLPILTDILNQVKFIEMGSRAERPLT